MRGPSFLGTVLLLLIIVAIIGFSRGWFTLSQPEDPTGETVNVNLSVDPNKMQSDAAKLKQIPEAVNEAAENFGKRVDQATPNSP